MNNIEKQIDYYSRNKQTIDAKYAGKAIIINERLEIEEYANEQEGYRAGLAKYGYGNFLLKNIWNNSHKDINIVSPIITTV